MEGGRGQDDVKIMLTLCFGPAGPGAQHLYTLGAVLLMMWTGIEGSPFLRPTRAPFYCFLSCHTSTRSGRRMICRARS